jgi:hypothetical protein
MLQLMFFKDVRDNNSPADILQPLQAHPPLVATYIRVTSRTLPGWLRRLSPIARGPARISSGCRQDRLQVPRKL